MYENPDSFNQHSVQSTKYIFWDIPHVVPEHWRQLLNSPLQHTLLARAKGMVNLVANLMSPYVYIKHKWNSLY